MLPRNQSQFLEGSIHLIYAVVAAQGFATAGTVYIPLHKLFTSDGALNGFALIFVYFFLSAAWLGFYNSVKVFKHTWTKKGILRYSIGLLNAFILFYMITLISTQSTYAYSKIFFLLAMFFLLVFIAHAIKYKEYKSKSGYENNINHLWNTMILTGIFLAVFFIQASLHYYLSDYLLRIKWDGYFLNPVFIVTSILATLIYRWLMWNEWFERKRRNLKEENMGKSQQK